MAVPRIALLLVLVAGLQPLGSSLAAQAYPPGNVAVTQGPAGVTVTWSMVKGRGVTYRVLRSMDAKDPGQDLTKPIDYAPEGFVDLSASPKGTYFYSVIAVYGPGSEAASAPVQFPAPQAAAPPLRNKSFTPPAPAPAPVPAAPIPAPAPMPVPLPAAPPTNPRSATPMAPPGPGPAPGYLHVVGTPAEAHVTWNAPPGASGFTVTRWSTTDPNCCRLQSAMLPGNATSYDDLVQWTGTYTFRVTAVYPPNAAYPGGRQGYADVGYVYPEPYVPTGFTGKRLPDGSIKFTWDMLPHASGYVFAGPPTNVAVRLNVNTTTITVPPPTTSGNLTWQLSSVYDPPSGATSRAGSKFVTTSVNVPGTGKYRVVAQMIQVTQTTGDTPPPEQVLGPSGLRNDGPGDEVFLTSLSQTIRRSDLGVIQTFPILVSAVHGDVATWPQDNRARAGTASGWGGLRAGDVIAPVYGPGSGSSWPLFILWEGTLTDATDDLVVHPVIWDADQANQELSRTVGYCPYDPQCRASAVEYWARTVVNSGSYSVLTAALKSPQITVARGSMLGSPYTHLEQQAGDRPIGLENYTAGGQTSGIVGRWQDVLVVLSRETIEAALASGKNTISIRMMDHTLASGAEVYHPQMGGDYTVVLRVERVP